MNWNYSLIVWDNESIQDWYKAIKKHSTKISRLKVTSRGIEQWNVSYAEVSEVQAEVRQKWIDVYVWWWITDKEIENWNLPVHISELQKHEIDTIEVWNPTPEIIRILQWEFKTVIGEIGSKSHVDEYSYDYTAWENSLKTSIDWWIENIILEGWTGNCWIYSHHGRVRTLLLMHLMRTIEKSWYDWETILEAFNPYHQLYMFNAFGNDINLSNISPASLLLKGWFLKMLPHPLNIEQIKKRIATEYPKRLKKFYEVLDYMFEIAEQKWINPSDFMFDSSLTSMHSEQIIEAAEAVKTSIREMVPTSNKWIQTFNFWNWLLIQIG